MHHFIFRKPLISVSLLTLFLFFSCNRNPVGVMQNQRKLVVFSVLNPAVRTQKLIVQQSLTFKEGQSNTINNIDIPGVTGALASSDADYNIMPMPGSSYHSDSPGLHHDTDFLWGNTDFNYIFDGPPVESGKTYQLSLTDKQHGTVTAEATVPGPFHITEINIEPQFSEDNLTLDLADWSRFKQKYTPDNFRLTWSKSEGADGYWVDISVMEYEIPSRYQLDTINETRTWPDYDSTQVVEIPYREYPVRFPQTENTRLRGFLTVNNSLEMPLDDFIQLIDFPQDFQYRFGHTFRIKVYVHAMNQALYNYFLEGSSSGDKIGEVKSIPNFNFIDNGYGIFGAAYTQSATARLYDYILGIGHPPVSPAEYLYWYYQFNDVYSLDQIINDDFSRLLFSSGVNPPTITAPANETVLSPDEDLTLSWDPVEDASKYVVVLKPDYLWFKAGNVVKLSDENHIDISWDDMPYRDSRIEWYVKALSGIDHEGPYIVDPASDKAPLVYSNEIASPWSESHYITTESGALPGFDSSVPEVASPQNGGSLSTTDSLSWNTIDGADAYLVSVSDDKGHHYSAVTTTPAIAPPFSGDTDLIQGLTSLTQFESGVRYNFQVCGLRVKSGTLSFILEEPEDNNSPPQIYPRYQHPSGIIMQSQWSDSVEFTVE